MYGPTPAAASFERSADYPSGFYMVEAVGELAHAGVADSLGCGAVRDDRAATDDAMGAEAVFRHDIGASDLVERNGLDRRSRKRRMTAGMADWRKYVR